MVDVTVSDHGNIKIITLGGEFYLESVAYVEEIWDEQLAQKPDVIGIQCRELRYIDSSAIGAMVKFLNTATKNNVKLVFFDLSGAVISVFKTAKLHKFFTTMTREEFEGTYLK